MSNNDRLTQTYREMADDNYFNLLAGERRFKNKEDYEAYQEEVMENMTACELCKAGLIEEDDYFDKCGEVGCPKFQCPDFKNSCILEFKGKLNLCDLTDDCFLFKNYMKEVTNERR